MKPRTKSVLILAVAVILGIVVGALLHAAIVNRRLDEIARLRTTRGLGRYVERVVRPESPEQRAAIRRILEEAAPRYAAVFRRSRQEMQALTDTVLAELSDVLTEEQLQRLREHMQRPERLRRGRPGGPTGPRGRRMPGGMEPLPPD